MLRRVQRAGAAVLVDPEGDEGEEGAENDGRLHHAVVVELAQELGAADPSLVELGLVDLGMDRSVTVITCDGLYSNQAQFTRVRYLF